MAANLEGAFVCKDMSSTKGFQPVCALCEVTRSLFTLPHNGYTAKLQQMAQLNDQLTHCAVGCVQDDTVPWLQSQNTTIERKFGYGANYFATNILPSVRAEPCDPTVLAQIRV